MTIEAAASKALALDGLAALLESLVRDGVVPAVAEARLSEWCRDHGSGKWRLAWEEDPIDGGVHYDAFLDTPDGTLSLAYCADRGIPWSLRGARPWSEQDIVQVDGQLVRIPELMLWLDGIWDQPRTLDRIVETCIIRSEIARRQIQVDPTELQRAINSFRAERRLESADAFRRWLKDNGTTLEDLELQKGFQLAAVRLREEIASEDRIAAYLRDHSELLRRAHVFRCSADTGEKLNALKMWCAEPGVSLEAAIARDPDRFVPALKSARFSCVTKGLMDPSVASTIFSARRGDIIGPFRDGADFALVEILDYSQLSDDRAAAREFGQQIVFQEWLTARRREANVRWFWGQRRQ